MGISRRFGLYASSGVSIFLLVASCSWPSKDVGGGGGNLRVESQGAFIDPDDFETFQSTTSLVIPTYDANPNCTHPSVVFFHTPWNGFKYWMAFTPYPAEDRENPSILQSHDGDVWTVPQGLTNPIDPSPGGGRSAPYWSDPDLVFNHEDNKLYCFYRWSDFKKTTAYYYKTSDDGVHWSERTLILSVPDPAPAPSFVHKDGYWWLWYVDARGGNQATPYPMRFRKAPTLAALADATEFTCTIKNDDILRHNWHDQIRWDASLSQFVGFFCYTSLAYSHQPNNDGVLYWGTSPDGLNWTLANRIMPLDEGAAYRSTFCRTEYARENGATFDTWYTYKWSMRRTLTFVKPAARPEQAYDHLSSVGHVYSFLTRRQQWYGMPVARLFCNRNSELRDVYPDGKGDLRLANGVPVSSWCSSCSLDRLYDQMGGYGDYLFASNTRPLVSKGVWSGYNGWGISFNGSTDVLETRRPGVLMEGITVSANITNVAAAGRMATIKSGSTYFGINAGKLVVMYGANIGGTYTQIPGSLTGVWGARNNAYVRQNSSVLRAGSTADMTASAFPLALGAQWATTAYTNHMAGTIVEAVIWKQSPTLNEVATVENRQLTDFPFKVMIDHH